MSAKAATAYRCPNKCGDSRYPQPKWTTKAGYDSHMAKCHSAAQVQSDGGSDEEIRDSESKED